MCACAGVERRQVPGHSWDWVTGPVRVHHLVEQRSDGDVVSVELSAPWPIETALRLTYRPLLGPLIRIWPGAPRGQREHVVRAREPGAWLLVSSHTGMARTGTFA